MRIDPAQDRRADQHAPDELAQDGRLSDLLRQGPHDLRRGQDHDQHAQKMRDVRVFHRTVQTVERPCPKGQGN